MGFGIRPLWDPPKIFKRMELGFSDDPRVPVEHLLLNSMVHDNFSLSVGMSLAWANSTTSLGGDERIPSVTIVSRK
jgi:hypothetical protein